MSHPEKEPLFDGWATLHQPETPRIAMFGKSYIHDPLAPRLSRQPVPGMAVFEMFDVSRKRPLSGDRSWYDIHFSIKELSRVVLVLWRQTAIIRYHELWGPLTIESFIRACRGTARLRQWLQQVMRGSSNREDRLTLKRQSSEKWVIPDMSYPHIRRWSSQAIKAAKDFAWTHSRKNNIPDS